MGTFPCSALHGHDQFCQVPFQEVGPIDLKPNPSMEETALLFLCGTRRMDQDYAPLADHLSKASFAEKHSVVEASTWLHLCADPKAGAHTFTVSSHTQVSRGCEGAGGWLRKMKISSPSVEEAHHL